MRPAAAALTFLILCGRTREETTGRLKDDIRVDTIDIIHSRFPCRSPDLDFFCYRFQISLKGESAIFQCDKGAGAFCRARVSRVSTRATSDAFLNRFVHDYNRTRLKCLGYIAPLQALSNLPGPNTFAETSGR